MNPERWQQIQSAYYAALELRPADRTEFLNRAYSNDPELRREVQSLLVHENQADQLLEKPAWKMVNSEPLAAGTRLGAYTILALLGRGGMGEVYHAEDSRLKRSVAIKILQDAAGISEEERLRFLQEARAASALNHPNIVQIYEFGSTGHHDFIVMEYLRGKTLAETLAGGRLPVPQALDLAAQIASALAAAHAAGIVHRDIKPGNMIVDSNGVLKILDFGLAKRVTPPKPNEATMSQGPVTKDGMILGTAAYMSPEQAEGKPVDARSDIFSTGTVLYEMLCGKRAFPGESAVAVLTRVVRDSPTPIRSLRPEVPKALDGIVTRCLEKSPSLRFDSGAQLFSELARMDNSGGHRKLTTRARIAIAFALALAIASAGWSYRRYSRAQWVRNQALPEIRRLIAASDYLPAVELIRTAQLIAPDDPELKQHFSQATVTISLTTTPEGATVAFKSYGDPKAPWRPLGQTPLAEVPIPLGYVHLRIAKEGFEPTEFPALTNHLRKATVPLHRSGSLPDRMVPVPQRSPWAGPFREFLPDYFIDKFEVTNLDFMRFVKAGGYRDPKFWREPFEQTGKVLSFAEAMDRFRDATGRTGPAVWELGEFRRGQADHPVAGVSWYEANAYCTFAGKSLPTVEHWRKVAGRGQVPNALFFSNFNTNGTAPAGSYTGIAPFGAYDVFGNVREWCYNGMGRRRAVAGGSWTDNIDIYRVGEFLDPFTRTPADGFRCALYTGPVPNEVLKPIALNRDYSKEKPISDEAFAVIRRLYEYDPTPIEPRTEAWDDSNPIWRKERVSYRAGYGEERIPANLYLPRNATPPYQTVLWVPGGYGFAQRSSQTSFRTEVFTFLLRRGRAVLHPVYKGQFERPLNRTNSSGPKDFRDGRIHFFKDVFRSLDYLEARPDIRKGQFLYYSLKDIGAPIALALEPRFRAAVLISSNLLNHPDSPEIDPFNFAPRVRIPVLMINGSYDFINPPELQELLFRTLGSPSGTKRLVPPDGHLPKPTEIMRETLDWIDRYLGPLETKP